MTTVSTARVSAAAARHGRWQAAYVGGLAGADAAAVVLALVIARISALGTHGFVVGGLSFTTVLILGPLVWVALLAVVGAYDPRYLGLGADEYKRVSEATIRLVALGSAVVFVAQTPVARGFVGAAVPLMWLLTLLGRWIGRKVLHHRRARGGCLHRVLVVTQDVLGDDLARQVRREPHAGYDVVSTFAWTGVPAVDGPRLLTSVRDEGVDTVAVSAGSGMPPEQLRQLAWQLEGTGVQLVVAPALTNIAGPRIHIRPVAGLPLLHVEEPDLTGRRQLIKIALDRLVAFVALLLLSPLLLGVGLAIRLTSPGPAFFRQLRLGRGGKPFTIYKFRTMYDGADARFLELVEKQGVANKGGMFVKDKQDPRVTPLGRWLRRLSLDELPQMLNVLRGDMSLVGPRPLPVEVIQDGEDVRRRLLVRPGITGLWQISGRSDLPWEDAVRIDLYYVENWSLSFDILILCKTLLTVLRSRGAY